MTGLNWNRRTSSSIIIIIRSRRRRRTSTWTGLSLCATIATLIGAILLSGFSSHPGIVQNVDCVPVKLVADFPTFAATLLGSLNHQQQQQEQQQQSLVTSSSSSSYLTNDRESDDDSLDEQQPSAHLTTSTSASSTISTPTAATKVDSPPSSRYSSSSSSSSGKTAGTLADYESDLLEKIQSTISNSSLSTSVFEGDNEDGGSILAGTSSTLQTLADIGEVVATSSSNNILAFHNNASDSSQSGGHNSSSSGSSSGNSISTTLTLLGAGGGAKKSSHIIRLPNGQSFQFCDEQIDLNCRDENAVCKMGACVCKPGFFLHRQSGECQSISDLLKNCENDYQCQAFDVDLVCDTKSHERSFCDCAEGLYFDQDTYSCIPCHRNTFVLATNNKELLKKLNQSQTTTDSSAPILNSTSTTTTTNTTSELNVTNSSNNSAPATTLPPIVTPSSKGTPTLRPCKPIDLAKLNYRRRKQQHQQQQQQQQQQVPYSSLYDQPARGSGSSSSSSSGSSTAGTSSTSSTSYHPGSSSDPFRIRTPLEVFMGAIMLFTVLTVAWFFIQRMFHDCRVILRSLRNPDFTGHCSADGGGTTTALGGLGGIGGAGIPTHLTGILPPNSRPGSQLYLDPAGQAVARLLSNEHGYNSSLAGIYQRDLAGVMVQHLAANLSPSSTNHALAATNHGSFSRGDNEINLYPLAISSQQSRNAAAAAAAQLLLSPSHPAIAILRAAAASANQNSQHPDHYNQTSLLNSMLDSPPKYEEAIAQSGPFNQPSSYVPHHQQLQHDNQTIISRTCDDNDENTEAEDTNEVAADRNNSAGQYNNSQNAITNPAVDGGAGGDDDIDDADADDDTMNMDRISERNDDFDINNNNTASSDNSQPPAYQSVDTHSVSRAESSTTSSSGPSETEQTNSRRQNSTRRKITRRSRRGRGSINRNGQQQQQQQQQQPQQQQQQDSDDTLT